MNKTALLFTCLMVLSGYGYSATWRVPSQFATIQEAIVVISDGDTISIAPGVYYLGDHPSGRVIIENKANITLLGEDGRESTRIIGCGSGYESINFINSVDCTVEGITLTNSATLIHIAETSSGITINECKFLDPEYIVYAAIFIDNYASASISNNLFEKNCQRGIWFGSRSLTATEISNNQFSGNYGSAIVGYENSIANIRNNAMYNCGIGIEGSWGSGTTIEYNIIRNNERGIVTQGKCNPAISNNTIVGNITFGILLDNYAFPILTKNIVAQNICAGITVNSGCNPTITCNDVWGNSNFANGNYVGYITDQTGYNGNISVDPLFCNPSSDDYSLASNSLALMQTCGAMGAILEPGCSSIMAASEKSWGAIKSLYR